MKFYSIFILLLLIAFINSDCDDDDYSPSKKKDCKDRLTDSEKNQGYSHCCFIEIKGGAKGCWALSKSEYDNIEDYIKASEEDEDFEIKTLDCISLFLKLGFMNILFLLL